MIRKIPNILSTLRIFLAFVFLLLYSQPEWNAKVASLFVFFLAAVSDYLDGYIARTYNVATEVGVFLDPLADKFLTFTGFISLSILDPKLFPWWIVFIIMFRDVAVTMLRVYADRRDFTMKTRKSAKAKTLVQMVYLYVALIVGIYLQHPDYSLALWAEGLHIGIYVVMIITVYTGIEYIIVNRKIFKNPSV